MKKTLTVYLGISVAAAICVLGADASAGEWSTLFNGKDIEGWEQKGGEAAYKVEDGCLVGTTKPRTPNTFLCPPKSYGDFELTFDVKCDEALNSGVQIRSISSADEIPAGLSEKDAKKAKKKVSFFGGAWWHLRRTTRLLLEMSREICINQIIIRWRFKML